MHLIHVQLLCRVASASLQGLQRKPTSAAALLRGFRYHLHPGSRSGLALLRDRHSSPQLERRRKYSVRLGLGTSVTPLQTVRS